MEARVEESRGVAASATAEGAVDAARAPPPPPSAPLPLASSLAPPFAPLLGGGAAARAPQPAAASVAAADDRGGLATTTARFVRAKHGAAVLTKGRSVYCDTRGSEVQYFRVHLARGDVVEGGALAVSAFTMNHRSAASMLAAAAPSPQAEPLDDPSLRALYPRLRLRVGYKPPVADSDADWTWDPRHDPALGNECSICIPSQHESLAQVVVPDGGAASSGDLASGTGADEDADDDSGDDEASLRAATERRAAVVADSALVLTGAAWFENEAASNSFRVAVKAARPLPATLMDDHCSLEGVATSDSLTLYRVTLSDPTKVLTIRVEAVLDDDGKPIGDPDLYVSNRNAGAGPLTRDEFVWKSANVGPDRIDIHPDDPRTRGGSTFLVGVLGYKERNVYTLTTSTMDPLPIRTLSERGGCSSVSDTLPPGGTHYYSLAVDSTKRGKVCISIDSFDDNSPKVKDRVLCLDNMGESGAYGRGVYSWDDAEERRRAIEAAGITVDETGAATTATGERVARMVPLLHMSGTCMYPCPADHSWTAEPPFSPTQVVLERDEWRIGASVCFFALGGVPVAGLGAVQPMRYEIAVWEEAEEASLPTEQQEAFRAWSGVFADVDGGGISQKDRAAMPKKSSALTYGEVEFIPFLQVLGAAKPQEGDVFYDLGSGTGKALLEAALCFPFSKCVGIELLGGLVATSQAVLERARSGDHADATEATRAAANRVEIRPGSFLELDFSDADVVYTSSICFEDELMVGMSRCARTMKPGSRFITLKSFPDDEMPLWTVLSHNWWKMSWGRTSVYVLERNDVAAAAVGGAGAAAPET